MASLPDMIMIPTEAARSNYDLALSLARDGYHVFPCQPCGPEEKRPYNGVMWATQSTTDEARIAAWWERWPDAMPGIDLKKSGLIVIDLDGEYGIDDWRALVAGREMDDAPIVSTPSGGQHWYFRQPSTPLGNSRGDLPKKRTNPATGKAQGIDVRGAGGYVIAPGSMKGDGRYYVPERGDFTQCPVMPNWLVKILCGTAPSRTRFVAPLHPASDNRLSSYGQAALEDEANAVAMAAPGTRNETVNTSAFRLGQLVGGKCLSERKAYDVLASAVLSWGVKPNDKALGPRGTIQRALKAGMAHPRTIPDDPTDSRTLVDISGLLVDKETVEIIEDQPAAAPGAKSLNDLPWANPNRWLEPKGLIAAMAEWIIASSRRPNRPLAIASAIAVMSGICGRHLFSPTHSAMNLYIICLAPTAVGKGRPLSAIGEILRAAGLARLHTTAKAFSVSAIEAMVVEHPCCVATADEIGANLLTRMSHKKSSTHETAMRGAFLELYSREYGQPPYATHQRAGSASVEVPSPSLSLYGTSTPESFYESLTSGSVKDGFLNRFLIVNAAPRAGVHDFEPEMRRVPDSIIEAIRGVIPSAAGRGNISEAIDVFSPVAEPEAHILRWDDESTYQASREFEENVLAVGDANPDIQPFIGRVFENSVRLAGLHAVSRAGRMATVTIHDLEWGASLAIASARHVIDGAALMMSSSDYEANLNTIRKAIADAGTITRMDLLRRVRSVSARERDEVIKHLIEGGWIEQVCIETQGRYAVGWRWLG